MKKITGTVVAFLLTGAINAQERINADRPDQTESASLTPKKYFQAEFGFGTERSDRNNYTITYPTTLFKYGLSRNFELRLESNFVSNYRLVIPNGTVRTTGFESTRIGFRTSLWEQKNVLPKTSFLVHFGIPGFASQGFRARHVAPSFLLAMENDLTDKIDVGYNLGAEWDGSSSRPAWIWSVSFGVSLGSKFDAFLEPFGSAQKNEPAQNYVDAGLGFYLNSNMKFDVSAGLGISDASLKSFYSAGFSFRFH
jgi:hypothetical protein